MPDLRRTPEFDKWLKDLGDTRARSKVLVRIDRLECGNAGDVAPVGESVSEMRIHYGPGYRVYFRKHGEATTLLWGGTKDTQAADIAKAKALADDYED
jgi:putative addiction module killer protein